MKLSLKPRTYLSPPNSSSCLFILPLTSVPRQLGTCFLPLKLCLYFIECVNAQCLFFFFFSVLLISLRKTILKFIHIVKYITISFLHCWVVFHCVNAPQLVYQFMHWTFRMFLVLDN